MRDLMRKNLDHYYGSGPSLLSIISQILTISTSEKPFDSFMECSLLVPEWSGCLTLALLSRKLQRPLQNADSWGNYHSNLPSVLVRLRILWHYFKQAQELDNRRAFNQDPYIERNCPQWSMKWLRLTTVAPIHLRVIYKSKIAMWHPMLSQAP